MVLSLFFILFIFKTLVISFKTRIDRRPIIHSAKWNIVLLGISVLLPLIKILTAGEYQNLMLMLIHIVFVICIGIMQKGYAIYAASDSYVREALLASAKSLGFTIEETLLGLKIKETGGEIELLIQEKTGSALIKAKHKETNETLKQIVAEMNNYFKTTPGKMNYMNSYFFLFMGLCLIVMSTLCWYLEK
jgi:hypothetical protein